MQQDLQNDSQARLRATLVSFRDIGQPLLQGLMEVEGFGEDKKQFTPQERAAMFEELVESTVMLSQKLAEEITQQQQDLDNAARWGLASAAAQVVAAAFKTSGEAMTAEDADVLVSLVTQLQDRFKGQIPANSSGALSSVAMFRAKMMEAFVPVIGAVAQYAFGRGEHELLAEVSERLVKMADQVTRTLAAPGSTPEQWRLLCWNVLRAAGQIYTESHYAEADRILYMNPQERSIYLAQHGQMVPMTQVWQAFNQRMAMLATLAAYLKVPETAGFEKEIW